MIPADGLDRHSHDIWLPRVNETAPFDQTSAHRVDHEGPLILCANALKKAIDICCTRLYAFFVEHYLQPLRSPLFWGFDTKSCPLFFNALCMITCHSSYAKAQTLFDHTSDVALYLRQEPIYIIYNRPAPAAMHDAMPIRGSLM